jgi:F-type H+-transporting ATPase subunit b
MISVDETLLVQMINFFVFLFLMNMVLFRPIRRVVAQRQERLAKQQEQISGAEAGAARALSEFEEKIQAARAEGRQKVQEFKEGAYGYEKDLLQRTSEEAAQEVQEATDKVRQEIGAAREQLRKQVQKFAAEMAHKILGRSI